MSQIATLGGIAAPDSVFTRQATSLVARVHSPAMLNHVHRSWWFAEHLGRKRGLKYDREVVYLAALLHDLGLTEEYAAEGRFEADGADAASKILVESGFSEARAQLVWEGIALHSSLGLADHLGPETCLVCLGALTDVFGLKVAEIGPELVDETIGRYPRFGFKKAFQQALAEVAAKKPAWASGTGLADIGRRHVHGFQCADTCDLIDGAPFES